MNGARIRRSECIWLYGEKIQQCLRPSKIEGEGRKNAKESLLFAKELFNTIGNLWVFVPPNVWNLQTIVVPQVYMFAIFKTFQQTRKLSVSVVYTKMLRIIDF